MNHCNHDIDLVAKFVALKGAGIRCAACDAAIYCPHTISSSIFSGVGAFLFIPFIILLFTVGDYWWAAALGFVALICLIYVSEVLFGVVVEYDHVKYVNESNKRNRTMLIVLALLLLVGAVGLWLEK